MACQGRETRVAQNGLTSVRRHHPSQLGQANQPKPRIFARSETGFFFSENPEKYWESRKADADTVQYGATPPSVSEAAVKKPKR